MLFKSLLLDSVMKYPLYMLITLIGILMLIGLVSAIYYAIDLRSSYIVDATGVILEKVYVPERHVNRIKHGEEFFIIIKDDAGSNHLKAQVNADYFYASAPGEQVVYAITIGGLSKAVKNVQIVN